MITLALKAGIASGRPGRWHGLLEVTRDHETDDRLAVVETERCPHDHKTRQAAHACAQGAERRLVANGGQWLDKANDRRGRRVVRRSRP